MLALFATSPAFDLDFLKLQRTFLLSSGWLHFVDESKPHELMHLRTS
jgi:hypothetical protein